MAIKLKKKCNEQEKQIKDLQQSSTKESQQKLAQLSSNFSNLQLEYDNAQDSIEVFKKEISELTKALKSSVDEAATTKLTLNEVQDQLNQTKEKNTELEINLERNQKECSTLTQSLKEAEEKIETLNKEKAELSLKMENASSKLESMSGSVMTVLEFHVEVDSVEQIFVFN